MEQGLELGRCLFEEACERDDVKFLEFMICSFTMAYANASKKSNEFNPLGERSIARA